MINIHLLELLGKIVRGRLRLLYGCLSCSLAGEKLTETEFASRSLSYSTIGLCSFNHFCGANEKFLGNMRLGFI